MFPYRDFFFVCGGGGGAGVSEANRVQRLFVVFLFGTYTTQKEGTTSQRVLSTYIGDTYPNHNSNSYYRNPTFYYAGTLDPLGIRVFRSKYTP